MNEKHRRLAEIVEMLHTASLVHDDVLDDCDLRRGKLLGGGIPGCPGIRHWLPCIGYAESCSTLDSDLGAIGCS